MTLIEKAGANTAGRSGSMGPRAGAVRRVAGRLSAAVLLATMLWLPTVSSPPVVRAAVCTGWTSTTTPPPTIRVLRTSGPASGYVQTVNFNTYVKVVMPAEWASNWLPEVLRAGAVAIKQYAWYYTMHSHGYAIIGIGGCADVRDNTYDQIYTPEYYTALIAPSHVQAVDSTWGESITKNGAFILTGYRMGTWVLCGADADGYHLWQRSAYNCAADGKSGEQILNIYYGPGLVIFGSHAVPDAPTSVSAVPYDSSAQVSWAAPAFDGGSAITRYTVTSTPDGKICTTTGALTCAVSGLTNGTGYTFVVTATNAFGTSPASGPSGSVTPAPPTGATYVALTPARILDTRYGTGGLSGPFSSNVARTFQVTGHGGVPSNATAVTGNLTVTQQTNPGYLYVGPVAVNYPTSSNLNFPMNDDRANAVTVALGAGGSLSVTYVGLFGGSTAHVIFDVTGYFVPDTSGATYVALTPARILDTRDGTGGLSGPFHSHVARTFQVTGAGGVPSNATAVAGNLTATLQAYGYLFVGPIAANNPTSSTLNFPAGEDRANAVTVALGSGGTLSITYVGLSSSATAHVVFDVTGYFVPGVGGAKYVALTPTRILDTRDGTGGLGTTPFTSNVARTFVVAGIGCIPSNATAVTGNLTVTLQTNPGYLYIGPIPVNNPTSSNLNFPMGDDRANAVAVALGAGGTLSLTYVGLTGSPTAHAIFDATGYFVTGTS
jgi:hypothetical protein